MSALAFPTAGVHAAGRAVTIVCCVLAIGCVTPHARYTRPSRQARASKTVRTVPRNYDYRKHYRVPAVQLTRIIDTYRGVPYRYGGTSMSGMDCSGLVNAVFAELNRARLPRSSRAMAKLGRPVSRAAARPGDLVFFRGGFLNRINHVGIYVGDGRFAHASRSKGVTYSSLETDYYRRHFAGIRRIF